MKPHVFAVFALVQLVGCRPIVTAPRPPASESSVRAPLEPATGIVLEFGSEGTGPGQFLMPSGLASTADRIYVSDMDLDRVQAFDHSGNFLFEFGSHGSGTGQFDRAHQIAVGPRDELYVTDEDNHRIQVFDADGRFLRVVTPQNRPGRGLGRKDDPDPGLLEFNPADVAVDRNGTIYVTEEARGRLIVLDHRGVLLGNLSGFLQGSFGVAVGPDRSAYVIDGPDVIKFDRHRELVARWNAGGDEGIYGIAVSSGGAVFTCFREFIRWFTLYGQPLDLMGVHTRATVIALDVTPNGELLATAMLHGDGPSRPNGPRVIKITVSPPPAAL